jgi:hypothetical protein
LVYAESEQEKKLRCKLNTELNTFFKKNPFAQLIIKRFADIVKSKEVTQLLFSIEIYTRAKFLVERNEHKKVYLNY